jgi:hypothetical protein
MKRSILITIGSLALAACGSGQKDQPTAASQAGGTPPYGPGPAETVRGTEQYPEPPEEDRSAQDVAQGVRSMSQDDIAAACPLRVEGTSVRAEDAPGGIALVFTTSGNVDQVRNLAGRMAEMHTQFHSGAQPHSTPGTRGEQPPGHAHGEEPEAGEGVPPGDVQGHGGAAGEHGPMHRSTVRAEDSEDGARLVFTPVDPAHLEALREDIRHHAGEMTLSGRCPAEGFGVGVRQPAAGGDND